MNVHPMPEPRRFGPTRGELWVWLAISIGGFAMVVAAVAVRGMPSGPALIEVFALPGLLFGWLGGRSVVRLIRRDHP